MSCHVSKGAPCARGVCDLVHSIKSANQGGVCFGVLPPIQLQVFVFLSSHLQPRTCLFVLSFYVSVVAALCCVVRSFARQKSKQDIDKPKVQSLEDILKELDEEDEPSDEEQEAERRMEELLAGELVGGTAVCFPRSLYGTFPHDCVAERPAAGVYVVFLFPVSLLSRILGVLASSSTFFFLRNLGQCLYAQGLRPNLCGGNITNVAHELLSETHATYSPTRSLSHNRC